MRASTAASSPASLRPASTAGRSARCARPRRENCRFFGHAAQAESAGFRPCLRCRPELAPHSVVWSIQDASYILAHQAARLLDDPEAWGDTAAPSVEQLASAAGRERPPCAAHLRSPVRRFAGAVPANAQAAHRQAIAGRHRPADHAGRARSAATPACAASTPPSSSTTGSNPTQLRREGAAPAGRKAWRSAWAIGRPTTCRPCSASSPSARSRASSSSATRAARLRWAAPCPSPCGGKLHDGWLLAEFDEDAPPGGAARQRLAARSAAARDPPPARRARPGRRPAARSTACCTRASRTATACVCPAR